MWGLFDIFIFIFGLIIGSFLNCVIYRLEKEKSLSGRSFCPNCQHTLSWQDLLPVLSFIILRRKCRYCKQKISWQYPAVEIATGILFLLIFNFSAFAPLINGASADRQFLIFNFQLNYYNGITTILPFITTLYLLIIFSLLIIIFVYDLKHYIIPDKILFPAIILVIFYKLFFWLFSNWNLIESWKLKIENLGLLANPLASAFGACLFFLIIFLVSMGKGMGFGDVKLAFFMGLFLGYPNILAALLISFWIGAIIGIILILLKRKTIKSEVPFGPFLILGTFIALFWGQNIINWYLNYMV